MPSPLGIRRPPILLPGADNSYEHPPDPYRRSAARITDTISTSATDQQATITQEGPPYLPDELWVKIWTIHASDWLHNGHFYIVDNGPWLINIWRGCLHCQLPIGLRISHFSRDIVLSTIRSRAIPSWEDEDDPERSEKWARRQERLRIRGEDDVPGLSLKAEALIDFRRWAKSCDMKDAPREMKWVTHRPNTLFPDTSMLHYRQ